MPIPPDINSNSVIHGAMDNFDDDPCYATILMLFQNQSKKSLSKSVKAIENQNQSRKPQQTLRNKQGVILIDISVAPTVPGRLKDKFSDDFFNGHY